MGAEPRWGGRPAVAPRGNSFPQAVARLVSDSQAQNIFSALFEGQCDLWLEFGRLHDSTFHRALFIAMLCIAILLACAVRSTYTTQKSNTKEELCTHQVPLGRVVSGRPSWALPSTGTGSRTSQGTVPVPQLFQMNALTHRRAMHSPWNTNELMVPGQEKNAAWGSFVVQTQRTTTE